LLQKLDLNNDGVITVDEFINYCSMVSKATRSEVLGSAVKTASETWVMTPCTEHCGAPLNLLVTDLTCNTSYFDWGFL
jgi:hypothetical protein